MWLEVRGLAEKLATLFSRFPNEPAVTPESFVGMYGRSPSEARSASLSFLSVPDKFYFLLFGAICARLHNHLALHPELIVVRAVNGAVGTGWLAGLKRSALVAWFLSAPWIRAYGPLVNGIAYRCATWAHPIDDMADWIMSKHLWRQLQKQGRGEAYKLNIGDIEVADLIINSYLRFKPAPIFNVQDSFVRRLIWQALRDIRQANAYFRRAKPRWHLTSYTSYLEHGIPARVALRHGVTVWSFGNLSTFGKRLTQSDPYQSADSSRYRADFDLLSHQSEALEAARKQLEKRLSGGIDLATSYMRQSAYRQFSERLPEGLSGATVIFLHDFYDSPHVYPHLIFDDFWQWACFTIEILKNAGVNLFLKPHPNQIALSEAALNDLRDMYPSLNWLPAAVSNIQLARAGIACGITAYGTVAHELAYLGVPSIGCAQHPHHTFDFCRTARTRKEYESMLRSYDTLPVPKEEMRRQALAFYYMHNLYGNEDQSALRQAFVNFWRACNADVIPEESVMRAFQGLVRLPAFDRFIDSMARSGADAEQ